MARVSKKAWAFGVVVFVLIVLLYPFQTIAVPEWRARIVDEAGHPMRMTRVREHWQHYTIESADHEEDSMTDDDGYVTFPRRTVRGSLLVRIGTPILNVFNAHSSSGAIASLNVIDGPALPDSFVEMNSIYIEGQPLPTTVVLKSMPAGKK